MSKAREETGVLTVSGRYLSSIGQWSGRVGSKDRTGREKMTPEKRAKRKARITLPKVGEQ